MHANDIAEATDDAIAGLFGRYAEGFDDFDADAIARCYTYPCTIWQLGAGHVFADSEELLENIEALLDVFEAARIVHSRVEVTAVHRSGDTALATVAWRQEDEAGEPALAFTCDYALIRREDGWRIAFVINRDDAE